MKRIKNFEIKKVNVDLSKNVTEIMVKNDKLLKELSKN